MALVLAFTTWNSTSAAENQKPRTMRLDYYHSGNVSQEMFSLGRVVIEPLAWPGNPAKPIDDLNLGRFLFEIHDRESNRLLYSRGFDSIYGEWETTDEAKQANRTFQESLRFPAPEKPVQVIVKKRDARNVFHEVWTTVIDPADMFIDRSVKTAPAPVLEIEVNGDPANKVDLLLLGDGYTRDELKKFENDARRFVERLFSTSPFKERRKDFNVRGLCLPSAQSGVSRPSAGVYRASPLGTCYDAFGSERYLLSFDNEGFRNLAQWAPYEHVEIIANMRTYGGGGIYNLYSTVAADNAQAAYVFVHEFGHHFAALGDEYFTSPVAYNLPAIQVEPWEPNITALLGGELKWKDLVTPGVEIPTPWKKDEYENYSRDYAKRRAQIRAEKRPEQEMEALFVELHEFETKLFASEKNAGKVGAFEGAMYQSKGYYRSQLDCLMFTRSAEFCVACKRGIERVIDLYSR